MQRATHWRDRTNYLPATPTYVPRSTAKPVSPPFLRPQQRHTSPELPSVIEYNTWMGVAGLGVRATHHIPQLLRNPAPNTRHAPGSSLQGQPD